VFARYVQASSLQKFYTFLTFLWYASDMLQENAMPDRLEREHMDYQPYGEPHDISPAWTPREYLDYHDAMPAYPDGRAFPPQQQQAFREYAGYYPSAGPARPGRIPQRPPLSPRPPAGAERMSKAEALELLEALKKALVWPRLSPLACWAGW
jgi:hypothetical protein